LLHTINYDYHIRTKLTSEEKAVFEDVVYNRLKAGEYETIQKWVIPIRYKIYGDTSAYLIKEVDSAFSLIKKLTSLDIKRTTDEDEANFRFVFSDDPEFFKDYTLNKQPLESPGNYRKRGNAKGEIFQAVNLINTKLYGPRQVIKSAIKRLILKNMGFSKTSDRVPYSLFSTGTNLKIKIDDFDAHIISTLYLPILKAGMARDEVDKILN
jgi:hypothetical protein